MDFNAASGLKPRRERQDGDYVLQEALRPLQSSSQTQSTRQENQPPPRKRARMACTWCRDRKVRCDVSIHGKPCTNCRLDRHECNLRPTVARGRSVENALMRKPTPTAKTNAKESVEPNYSFAGVPDTPSQSPFLANLWRGNAPFDKDGVPFEIPRNSLPSSATDLRSSESSIIFSVYSFLGLSNLTELPPEDVKFLEMKGCLHIPAKPILNEFVRHYFLHVHPCLPVLNEADFWHIYHNRADRPNRTVQPMSLFTFQAMLFASCAFVPPRVIKAAGFEDTRTARNVLYFRAKFLFDLKAEKNDLSKAQGAVLLSYQSSSFEFHAGSLWLTMAIQNAILCGAHVYDSKTDKDYDDPQRNTKKRLWWSILLRDRILPLGLRRHLQITPENFNLDLSYMTEEDLEDEIYSSDVYDPETKRLLSTVLRVQCELAIALTSVITAVYSPNGFGQPRFMTQKEFTQTLQDVENSRAGLAQWARNAKSSLGTIYNSDKVHESVTLYSGLTFLYYQAARLALCHFEALMLEIHQVYIGDSYEALLNRIRDELENAASCITNSVKEFLSRGVARHLPISAIAYTALPLLLNALDVKLSASTSQVATRKRRLRYYAEVMQLYRDRYDGTDGVAVFIQQALRFADSPNFSLLFQQNQEDGKQLVSSSWPEVFTCKPRLYLRLSLTLDYAFTRGSFPHDADLPELVRELHVDKNNAPLAPAATVDEIPDLSASSQGQKEEVHVETTRDNEKNMIREKQPQSQPQKQQPEEPLSSPTHMIFPTEILSASNLNANNYFEFQGITGPDSSAQPHRTQLPFPLMRSFSDSSPHLCQEYPVFQHLQHPAHDETGLDFLAFGSPLPDTGAAVSTIGVDSTLHAYQDDQANTRLDFNEEIPMWNDHMLNELLSAPPT